MAVTVLGIDLAKNVFALHGVDHKGNTILCKPKVSPVSYTHLTLPTNREV